MMFLTCVSVHRFLGVCFPIAAVRLRTKKRALFASGAVWVLATAEILPTLVFAHTGEINNVTVCFEMTNPGNFKVYFPYGLFLAIVGFLIPFLVVITCYCSTMRALCCRAADRVPNARTARMRNTSIYMLLVVCLMFVVCFVPYHIARTAYLFVRVVEACGQFQLLLKSSPPLPGLRSEPTGASGLGVEEGESAAHRVSGGCSQHTQVWRVASIRGLTDPYLLGGNNNVATININNDFITYVRMCIWKQSQA